MPPKMPRAGWERVLREILWQTSRHRERRRASVSSRDEVQETGRPRYWFHVLLGAVFVPCLSLPVVWAGAIYWLKRAVHDEDRRWAKRILGLAVVDTVVLVALGIFTAASSEELKAPPVRPPVVVGVNLDPSTVRRGVRIESVAPGSPAAAAGLEAGDIILHVNTAEVNSADELRSLVRASTAGVGLGFQISRGGTISTVQVKPVPYDQLPRPKVGFFEAREGTEACSANFAPTALIPAGFVLGALAVLGGFALRRGAARGVVLTGAALGGWSAGTLVAYAGTCALLGGPTAAAIVFAFWGSSLGLAAMAAIGQRFSPEESTPPPTRTWLTALGFGAWYVLGVGARLNLIIAALAVLLPGAEAFSANPIASVGQGLRATGGPGLWLLAFPVVLFAPIGEELAFRGLLLPSLCRWMPRAAAIGISSILFAALHWYYGLLLPLVILYGVVLGWARMASGGLRAPIILHVIINCVSFLSFVLRS